MAVIVVTGGSGLVGRSLIGMLLQQGHQVIILTRNGADKTAQPGLRYAEWNVKKKLVDIAAIQQADYIIHLAGAGVVDKKWTERYKKEIQESRTQSSLLLADAMKNSNNKVKAVVSMSAIGWYGADKEASKPFEENEKADTGFLGETCKLWEESMEPVIALGKRLVKLRTGIVLSNDGGALAEFKKPLQAGVAAILGNGKQVVSWIHMDDLCRMIVFAIENEALQGSYNAVAPEPVTNKTLTLTLASLVRGRFFIPVYVPAFILKLMMGERSMEVLKSTMVSSKKIQAAGFNFQYAHIESALKNLTGKS